MKVNIEEIEPFLGRVSDTALADKFNLTRERIRQLRKERNIPKVGNSFDKPTHKRTQMLVSKLDENRDIVGSLPDHRVAKILGVTPYAVKKYRVSHGIKTWNHRKFDAKELREIEKDLGILPDQVVAQKYKVSRITVFRLRKDKNIPSTRGRQLNLL